jgi:cobalt-precorrin 5A hydrolase
MSVAGLGFRSAAQMDSLQAALNAALSAAGLAHGSPVRLTALATAADKAQHPAFLQLATKLALPALAIDLSSLSVQHAAPSHHVPTRYGNHSVAEAAALAGAGSGARLLQARCVSPDHVATAAIATVAAAHDNATLSQSNTP